MKKLFSVLLSLMLMLVPLFAVNADSVSVELSHEWAKFDMGDTHSVAIQPEGLGYAWGYNYDGPIGNGITAASETTVPYNFGSGVAQVSANRKTTLFVDTNGVLYALGEIWWGTGGSSTMPSGGYVHTTPYQLATNVRSASMGFNHMVYVKNDNTLWVYGENAHGQLGDNTTTASYTAKQILTDVQYAVAGDCITAAVKTDGTLYVWGFNGSGQVGNGSTTDRKTPVQVLTNVYTVSVMGDHVAAIKNDKTLWTWGDNSLGQLGNGSTSNKTSPAQVLTNVAQVSAGMYHTGVIKTDGTLWFCGSNYRGSFGNGTTGGYSQANSTFRQTAGTYLAVSCGTYTSAAVAPDGQLWVAGWNNKGQLGTGNTTSLNTLTPINVWLFNNGTVTTHTVKFVDWNGTVLKTEEVEHGAAATAPAVPGRTGYTFTGWDKDFSSVTEDMTVTAQYSINSYILTINYVDRNGTPISAPFTGTYTYGSYYAVNSPAIAGYTTTQTVVSGYMGAGNVTVTVTYTADTPVILPLLGDVDCNGVVDMSDISLLFSYLNGATTEITEQGMINADANLDGAVNVMDITAIFTIIANS